jgi:hypothetical protein
MRIYLAALLVSLAGAASAATPPPGAITVTGPGVATELLPAEIANWPTMHLNVMFGTDKGVLKAGFTGPLLWTVLCDTRAVDPTQPRALVRDYVVVTGGDGYSAVVALGEFAPMFEGKPVILADAMNGKPLAPGDFRLIIPGDQRGGRSVRDVVKIELLAVPGGS